MTVKFPLRLHLKSIAAQGSNVILIGRDEHLRRYTVQCTWFRPFFYVAATKENKLTLIKRGFTYVDAPKRSPLTFRDGPPGIDDVPTYEVCVDQPSDVSKRRRGFERTYQADVPYTRNFLVQTGIKDGFIVKAARMLGKDMLIVDQEENIEACDFRVPDRRLDYDIETNKPEGSNHYSPAIFAKGAVTCKTLHDTFDGTNFHSFIWHPRKGVKGKPHVEVLNRHSRAYGRQVDWHVHWYGSEYEMFEALLAFNKKRRPDIANAWNGHKGWKKFPNQGGFDMPYLINRARNLRINPGHWSPLGNAFAGYQNFGKEAEKGKWACYVDGMQLCDTMTNYQVKDGGFTASVPYSDLKRVVKDKLNYEMNKEPRKDLTRWWLDKPYEFLEYSFDDVDAVVGLERKEGYAEWAREIQQFAGTEDANRVFTPMSLINTVNLRLAKEAGVVVPSSVKEDTNKESVDEEDSVEGGFVMPPRRTGLQDNVAVLDLSKMYVEIIRSCNLSWETWVPDPSDDELDSLICVPSDLGAQFFLPPEIKVGLMPKSCTYLKKGRERYDELIEKETDADKIKALKKARDPAKQLVLAVFGTSLHEKFNLYRPEVGSAITGMGRHIITGVDRFLQSMGYFVQYSDTDSVFVPLKAKTKKGLVKEGEELCAKINAWFTEMASELNIKEHHFEIGMETILSPFVQGTQKKQYAGVVEWVEGTWQTETKYLVKGVPGIKSDAARITKDTTETIIRMILGRRPYTEILDYVRDVYESVLQGQVPLEDMVKAVTLNALPEDELPKSHYIHTAAKNGLKQYDLAYSVGQKVSIVRLKGTAKKQNVAIPEGEEIPEGMPVDLDHHATATVLEPIRGIMSWIGLDRMLDSIRTGTVLTKAMTLE